MRLNKTAMFDTMRAAVNLATDHPLGRDVPHGRALLTWLPGDGVYLFDYEKQSNKEIDTAAQLASWLQSIEEERCEDTALDVVSVDKPAALVLAVDSLGCKADARPPYDACTLLPTLVIAHAPSRGSTADAIRWL